MSIENLRAEYLRLRTLDNSGERGVRTHQEYVAAARAYAEELAKVMTESGQYLAGEQLEAAMARIEIATRPHDQDAALVKLRASIDEAHALGGSG